MFTLIHVKQRNTGKQNLERKTEEVKNIKQRVNGLVTAILNTKIREVENEIADGSGLVTIPVLSTNIGEVESKIYFHHEYITTSEFNEFCETIFEERLKGESLVTKSDLNTVSL